MPQRSIPVSTALAGWRSAAALMASLACTTAAADGWNWRLPLPQGNTLNAMTGAFGFRIAVGDGGSIVRAMFDTQWDAVAPITRRNLQAIVACNGVLVAVGDAGTILRSPDIGATWTAAASGTGADLHSVVCGNLGFMALAGTALLTSSDGQTWSAPATGITTDANPFFGNQYAGVLYADGRYLVEVSNPIFGNGFTTPLTLLTTTDAITWNRSDMARPAGWEAANVFLRSMSYGDGRYTLLHRDVLLTSTNGNNWTWNPLPEYGGALTYFRARSASHDGYTQRFVGVVDLNDPPISGQSTAILAESTDGANWSTWLQAEVPGLTRFAAFNNAIYGYGDGGVVYGLAADNAITALAAIPKASALTSVLRDGDRYFAAGRDDTRALILGSADGIHWDSQIPSGVAVEAGVVAALTRTGGSLVAVGTIASATFAPGYAEVALYRAGPDRIWSRVDMTAVGGVNAVDSIATGGGRTVATVGDSYAATPEPSVLLSTDEGISWSRPAITGIAVQLAGIRRSDRGFLAVGNPADANVYTSIDGVAWQANALTSEAGKAVVAVSFRDHRAMALIQAGSASGCGGCPPATPIILVSTNEGPWQTVSAPPETVRGLDSTSDHFYLPTSDGRLYLSVDGSSWSEQLLPTSRAVASAVAVDGSQVLAVTSGGQILQGPTGLIGDRVFGHGFE